MAAVALVLIVALVFPESAWAWTPGTHIWLGESILANLHLLPAATADLLHAFPWDFLYGSIAPDISLPKRFVPPGRHSHFWHVGQEVYAEAESDALRAFGLGYLVRISPPTRSPTTSMCPASSCSPAAPAPWDTPTGRSAPRPT